MAAILRSAGALAFGAVVGVFLIFAVEIMGQVIYPFPAGIDPTDAEAFKAAMANVPPGVLLSVLAAWAVGTFGGAAVAAGIARRSPVVHGLIIGVLFLLAGIANMLMIPHPLWFWVVGICVFLPAAYLGAKCVRARKA